MTVSITQGEKQPWVDYVKAYNLRSTYKMKGTHVMRSAPHHNEFETEPPTPFLVSNSCLESIEVLQTPMD